MSLSFCLIGVKPDGTGFLSNRDRDDFGRNSGLISSEHQITKGKRPNYWSLYPQGLTFESKLIIQNIFYKKITGVIKSAVRWIVLGWVLAYQSRARLTLEALTRTWSISEIFEPVNMTLAVESRVIESVIDSEKWSHFDITSSKKNKQLTSPRQSGHVSINSITFLAPKMAWRESKQKTRNISLRVKIFPTFILTRNNALTLAVKVTN